MRCMQGYFMVSAPRVRVWACGLLRFCRRISVFYLGALVGLVDIDGAARASILYWFTFGNWR